MTSKGSVSRMSKKTNKQDQETEHYEYKHAATGIFRRTRKAGNYERKHGEKTSND